MCKIIVILVVNNLLNMKHKGIIDQMEQSDRYSKFTEENLVKVVKDLSLKRSAESFEMLRVDEDTFKEKHLPLYEELKTKALSGYAYFIGGVMYTGHGGLKDYIDTCIKERCPYGLTCMDITVAINKKTYNLNSLELTKIKDDRE